MNKWAIRVSLGEGDWIYVTKDTGKCDWDLKPVLFEDKEEAEAFADTWRLAGAEGNVKVVNYEN